MDFMPIPPVSPEQNQTPTLSPSVELTPRKTFTPKFIGAIAALLVLGGVAYAGIWFWSDKNMETVVPTFTPREDETAGWKTYTNTEYGFEFKYPNTFVLDDHAPAKDNDFVLVCFRSGEELNEINFCVRREGDFSLQDIRQEYAPTGAELLPPQVSIGGNVFYVYGAGGGGVKYPDLYFYNLNGKLLVFAFSDTSDDKTPSEETKELENQILSTFKLTK